MKFIHLYHLNLRKRILQKKEKFPSQDKKIRFLDSLVLVLAFIMPLSILPQIIKMHTTQSVGDISVLTFSLLLVLAVPWLLYGMVHKEKVIVLNNITWIILHLTVIGSYLIYI